MKNIENKEQFILLDNLFNFYLDSKYVDEVISDNEVNEINAIVQKNTMLFRQYRTKTKAELNEAKYIRVNEFLSKFKAGIASGVDEYMRIADEIFTKSKYAELQPMFRNLKEVSDKDKQSILIDSKLLDILSEIEVKSDDDDDMDGKTKIEIPSAILSYRCPQQEEKIKNSEILLNIKFYPSSFLEVHRINPLLAKGCIVVSEKSNSDPQLDLLYNDLDSLHLCEYEKIPETISNLLFNPKY